MTGPRRLSRRDKAYITRRKIEAAWRHTAKAKAALAEQRLENARLRRLLKSLARQLDEFATQMMR